MTTMTILSDRGSGVDAGAKFSDTTALGITETMFGSKAARSTVFSLHVCETHITWSMSESVNFSNLFVRIDPASAKPKSE